MLRQPAPATPPDVIDVEAPPPILQQIFAALQTQAESQNAALDKSNAIFQQVQDTVRDKLGDMEGKVDALQQSRAETTTALLEQKDSIEQLQAQNETNSDEICNQRGSAGPKPLSLSLAVGG